MNIHESSQILLKQIYDLSIAGKQYAIARNDYNNMPNEERTLLLAQLRYLKEEGLIKPYTPCSGLPISYIITSDGIKAVENVQSAVPSQSITVNGNVSGIVGNIVTGNTQNNGLSFTDIQKLIAETVANEKERQEITKAIQPVYQRMELGAPLEKGILSKISRHLEKYQSVYAAVGQSILSYLLKI